MKTNRGRELNRAEPRRSERQRTNRLHLAGIQFVVYITLRAEFVGGEHQKSERGGHKSTRARGRNGLFAEDRHKGLI